MLEGNMKESHHSILGTSPSPISFLGAINASLVEAWIPVFLAAWEISFWSRSNWAWWEKVFIQKVVLNWQEKLWNDNVKLVTNLSSNSLSNLLEAPGLVKSEASARALGGRDEHTVVKVWRRLQIITRFLLQLLTKLLPLYRSYIGWKQELWSMKEKQKYWWDTFTQRSTEDSPLSVGMRCVSSISLPVASTVLPLSSRMRGVGLFTSLISTLLQFHKQKIHYLYPESKNILQLVFFE